MRTLPSTMIRVLAPFAPLFSKSVFQHVQLLLAGLILAPGKRTVASALRAVGLDKEKRFCCYHRVFEPCLLVESGGEPPLAGIAC
jgi:hypothetical protein